MIDSEIPEVASPTREQELLKRLDLLNPVPDAAEWQINRATTWWLLDYPASEDNTTLEDLHYNAYAERFSEDIGPVELVLCATQTSWNSIYWSLLCSRTDMKVKFYFWNTTKLWYVGDNWVTACYSLDCVCTEKYIAEYQESLGIRPIPLKEGMSIYWDAELGDIEKEEFGDLVRNIEEDMNIGHTGGAVDEYIDEDLDVDRDMDVPELLRVCNDFCSTSAWMDVNEYDILVNKADDLPDWGAIPV
jgi:hypothetical protein